MQQPGHGQRKAQAVYGKVQGDVRLGAYEGRDGDEGSDAHSAADRASLKRGITLLKLWLVLFLLLMGVPVFFAPSVEGTNAV